MLDALEDPEATCIELNYAVVRVGNAADRATFDRVRAALRAQLDALDALPPGSEPGCDPSARNNALGSMPRTVFVLDAIENQPPATIRLAAPELFRAATHSNKSVRYFAHSVLAAADLPQGPALLVPELSSLDTDMREHAAWLLGNAPSIPPEARIPLESVAKARDGSTERQHAVRALAALADPRSLPIFTEVLHSVDDETRHHAIVGITRLKQAGARAVAALEKIARTHWSARRRKLANDALAAVNNARVPEVAQQCAWPVVMTANRWMLHTRGHDVELRGAGPVKTTCGLTTLIRFLGPNTSRYPATRLIGEDCVAEWYGGEFDAGLLVVPREDEPARLLENGAHWGFIDAHRGTYVLSSGEISGLKAVHGAATIERSAQLPGDVMFYGVDSAGDIVLAIAERSFDGVLHCQNGNVAGMSDGSTLILRLTKDVDLAEIR